MDFTYTKEQEQLRQEVRQFVKKEYTTQAAAEVVSGLGPGPHMKNLLLKIGAKGWLLPYLPKEEGGLGLSYVDSFVVFDELEYGGIWTLGMPIGLTWRAVSASIVAPMLKHYGTEHLKKSFLLKLARGEVFFSISYTEPDAGSDTGALKTSAVKDGGFYVINGGKIFNSHGHYADYHLLAARTGPHKYKGISLFIVDSKTPGISLRTNWVLGGKAGTGRKINEVFFDNVRVPVENLIGEEGKGFYYTATAIDIERVAFTGSLLRLWEELVSYYREKIAGTMSPSKRCNTERRLAVLRLKLEIGRLLGYQIAGLNDQGIIANANASSQKLFMTELAQEIANVGVNCLGLYGLLSPESKWAPLEGKFEILYRDSRVNTVAGGTSDVQRNVTAIRGLGLPREP